MDLTFEIVLVMSLVISLLGSVAACLQGGGSETITAGVAMVHALACGALARREKGEPTFSVVLAVMGAVYSVGAASWGLTPLAWIPCFIIGVCLTPPRIECNEYLESHHIVVPGVAMRLRQLLATLLLCYGVYSITKYSELFPEDWCGAQAGFMIGLPLLSSVILAICWTRGTEPYKRT